AVVHRWCLLAAGVLARRRRGPRSHRRPREVPRVEGRLVCRLVPGRWRLRSRARPSAPLLRSTSNRPCGPVPTAIAMIRAGRPRRAAHTMLARSRRSTTPPATTGGPAAFSADESHLYVAATDDMGQDWIAALDLVAKSARAPAA